MMKTALQFVRIKILILFQIDGENTMSILYNTNQKICFLDSIQKG